MITCYNPRSHILECAAEASRLGNRNAVVILLGNTREHSQHGRESRSIVLHMREIDSKFQHVVNLGTSVIRLFDAYDSR